MHGRGPVIRPLCVLKCPQPCGCIMQQRCPHATSLILHTLFRAVSHARLPNHTTCLDAPFGNSTETVNCCCHEQHAGTQMACMHACKTCRI